jgi:hypothetical protein
MKSPTLTPPAAKLDLLWDRVYVAIATVLDEDKVPMKQRIEAAKNGANAVTQSIEAEREVE